MTKISITFFKFCQKTNILGNLFFFRYCTSNFRKMTFMAVNMMLTGALMIVLPFVKNFALLVTFRFLQVKKNRKTLTLSKTTKRIEI